MKTILLLRTTSPPIAIKRTLLLAEFCPVNATDLKVGPISARVTVACQKMLVQSGWHHDGINE